jgi:hypothetical protein
VKRGHRWLVNGNLLEGQWAYQNAGPFFLLWSTENYDKGDFTAGTTDFTVTNNVIRHGAMLFACSSAENTPAIADSYITSRILFQNNLAYDLSRYGYDDNGPGYFAGGYFQTLGCQNLTIRHNTLGLVTAPGPSILQMGGGRSLVEGLDFSSNILYLSFGKMGGIRNDESCTTTGGNYGCITSHPRRPKSLTEGSYKDLLGSYFVRTGAKVSPDYRFTNNVIIGGKTGENADALRDLTGSEIAHYQTQFPAGNFFPAGQTMAEREAAAGLTDAARHRYTLLPGSPYRRTAAQGGDLGANHEELYAARGLVTGVGAVQASATGAIFAYTAPDGNACAVDTSADGRVWSRTADKGGNRTRSVAVGGLRPRTIYHYRILCAFEPVNDGFVASEYSPDQITNGTFRTQGEKAGGHR